VKLSVALEQHDPVAEVFDRCHAAISLCR
jgi:hypothetical protein